MGASELDQFIDLLNIYFPPEWLRAALVLSLISTWVLVGLFAYLNQYTQRRYFSLWTTAWLFYALWLTASINLIDAPQSKLGMMLPQACIGVCALFLFWGNLIFQRVHVSQSNMVGAMIVVLLWSYIGTYQLEDVLWLKMPMFGMLGLASLYSGYLFFVRRVQRRYIGASVLTLGFVLWGVYLMVFPLLQVKPEFTASAFLVSANLQLIIVFGMIVLVLEEVRYESRTVRARLRQDVKRTRVLEKEVVASEDKYRYLFHNGSDAIFIIDQKSLAVLETNEAGCTLVGLPLVQVVGRTFTDFCPCLRPHTESLVENPARFREIIESQATLSIPRPDNTTAVTEGRSMPVWYAGRAAIQLCLRDLSERLKLEGRLRQAEKLSALGQLISGVAHELNNPLAIIMGRAQLLMSRGTVEGKLKSDIALINHESERASRIVQRLLAFARPQPPDKTELQLNDLVHQIVDLLRAEAVTHGIELVAELDPGLPATMADGHQLEQVLTNLIQNARHALTDRGPESPGRICVRTEVREGSIRMSVIDNGPGIAPQNLSKIFDPFFTTKPFGVGTGLGLSICYGIVKEHNGNLFVQSEPGKGAAFIMELPIVAPSIGAAPTIPIMPTIPSKRESGFPMPTPACPVRETAPATSPTTVAIHPIHEESKTNGHGHAAKEAVALALNGSNGQKPRVLLVDDEPAIAGVLCELLSESGFHIESANNGRQALDLIEKGTFDLILSDLKMPGMDGRELYRNLKEQHPTLSNRIIFLTGDTVSGDTRQFLDSLGTPWLSKPFNIVEVEDTVRSLLDKVGTVAH